MKKYDPFCKLTRPDVQPKSGYCLGIFSEGSDPSVALCREGTIVAFSEEERHLRYKHAPSLYPIRAMQYCLDHAGISLDEVDGVGVNWDLSSYTDGSMKNYYNSINRHYPPDEATLTWQRRTLSKYNLENQKHKHHRIWNKWFDTKRYPPILGFPHHFTHAFQAAMQSPFNESLVITIDGSGEENCTVLWHHVEDIIIPIYNVNIPHSLGWFYAAMTSYLGFRAYNGEYKVMGLACYGKPDHDIKSQISKILSPSADGVGYNVNPVYIHHGEHSFSDRFTDNLVRLLGRDPRRPHENITSWHENVAYATQRALEDATIRLVRWGLSQTGCNRLCVSGGVGLNVSQNTQLLSMDEVDDVFIHPLCADGGAAAGAAILASYYISGHIPDELGCLSLGLAESDDEIERVINECGHLYYKPEDLEKEVAIYLAQGRIIGWYQGRMEAGPRALGQRSILADPRDIALRDKVNAAIKFREYWRPFCPSMLREYAEDTLSPSTCSSRYMIVALRASEKIQKEAPAVVHVNNTARVQVVDDSSSRYYKLISKFGELTGIPALLNTSFNIKGEPIVCTSRDAIRTFSSTGLEVLVLGNCIILKDNVEQIHV